MTTVRCIVGDYQTWREEKGTGHVKNNRQVLLRIHEHTVDHKSFTSGNTGLWGFFFGKMFEACQAAGNNRGKLEKVYAYVRTDDEDEEKGYREFCYIQEDGGNKTRVIPATEPATAKNKTVTSYDGPLQLTPAHLSKTAPKIVEYIKSKGTKRY